LIKDFTQKKKRASRKTDEQKLRGEKSVKDSHRELIKMSQDYLKKSEDVLKSIGESNSLTLKDLVLVDSISNYSSHAVRQIDQINRRVLQGEVIPHEEKVFSIFEPHTEWISKGKAGVPVEFGIRVCILEDQHQFILHHRVMEKETDDQVAVPMIIETKVNFPTMTSCSFDKGFHSKEKKS